MPEDHAAKPERRQTGEARPAGGPSRPDDPGRHRGEAPETRDPTAAPMHPDALAPNPIMPDPIIGRPDGTESHPVPPHMHDEPEPAPVTEEPNAAEEFERLHEDHKNQIRKEFAEKDPVGVAKTMEQGGVPEDQARTLMQQLYPDMSPDEINRAIKGAGFHSVEPAPEHEELTPEEQAMKQEIEEELGPEAERVMNMPPGEAKIEAKSRLRDRLKDKSLKLVGSSFKYSTIGGGVFAFLLALLLVAHAPSK